MQADNKKTGCIGVHFPIHPEFNYFIETIFLINISLPILILQK